MRLRVSHTTRFDYSEPVFLEPHTIRLRPRSDCRQCLRQFSLELDPRPALLAEAVDPEGNDVAHAWFEALTETLEIRTDFEIETLRTNPFDFLLAAEEAERIPVRYGEGLRRILSAAIGSSSTFDPAVAAFAEEMAARSGRRTLSFLTGLSEEIRNSHKVEPRESGDPRPAAETLRIGGGACRDLAVLFVECCRHAGIASRFVSGYLADADDASASELHAWAEVFLPGGGWRGFDPTLGLAVSDRHVALAASTDYRGAAPTSGTFRGGARALPMQVHLRVETLSTTLPSAK